MIELKINCHSCSNHCCGENPHLTPLLMPSEEERFKQFSLEIRTPFRNVYMLRKKENGNCILLHDKVAQCSIYETKPLECNLYPFLLDFDKHPVNIKLDKRFCPNLSSLEFDRDAILKLVRSYSFPRDWVLAYKSLFDY